MSCLKFGVCQGLDLSVRQDELSVSLSVGLIFGMC